MTGRNSMLTLNISDFCSQTGTGIGIQTVLADLLNLENLGSELKGGGACNKYISPADVFIEISHDSEL
jgi:hypothetical protein